jgi:LPXTG-motif cell wall-anchored protein
MPLPDTGPGSSTTILIVGLALLTAGLVLVRLPQRRQRATG